MFYSFATKLVNFFLTLLSVALAVALVAHWRDYWTTVWPAARHVAVWLIEGQNGAMYLFWNSVFQAGLEVFRPNPLQPTPETWGMVMWLCWLVTACPCWCFTVVVGFGFAVPFTLFSFVGLIFFPLMRLPERYLDLGCGDFEVVLEPAASTQQAPADTSPVRLEAAVSGSVSSVGAVYAWGLYLL